MVLLSLSIVLLTYQYLESLDEKVTIYIAKEDLDVETIIDGTLLESISIGYEEYILFFSEAYLSESEIINQVVISPINKGEVLSQNSFLIKDSENDDVMDDSGELNSDYFLQEGERLAFISLPKTHALGGNLKKGQYIDLIYTSTSNETGGMYSSILLQKIEVYQVLSLKSESSMDVQIIVKPEQGMILSLAKYNGNIDFMLTKKNSKDVSIIPKLPEDLYHELLQAGYMLIDQSGNSVHNLSDENQSLSDLERELQSAEKNLEAAFNAMNAAKQALATEKNENAKKDLYELVIELESAVRDLELAVDSNKIILETMKGGEDE